MPSRKCPVCGASVNAENLPRHLASVHPKDQIGRVFSAPAQDTTFTINAGRAADSKWQQSYSFNFTH